MWKNHIKETLLSAKPAFKVVGVVGAFGTLYYVRASHIWDKEKHKQELEEVNNRHDQQLEAQRRLHNEQLEVQRRLHDEQLETLRRHSKVVVVDYPKRVKFLQQQYVQGRVTSIRNEVAIITDRVLQIYQDGGFMLIRGPRGVGKTSAIYSALKDTNGCIEIGPVMPGTDQDTLLNKVCKKITGLDGSYEDNCRAMATVASMFQKANGRPLIVLIQASEHPRNKDPAALTAAARILADSHGLTVIIDCSENACPPTLTGREEILNFEPLSCEMMRTLPKYQAIAKDIEKQGNDDIVLAVCGGRPLLLDELSRLIAQGHHKNLSIEHVVRNFVMNKMATARESIRAVKENEGVREILEQFKKKSEVPSTASSKKMPDMKEVLRKVIRNQGNVVFVPATGAVALQLRIGLDRESFSFNEIKEWLEKQDVTVKASLLLREASNN